MLRGIFAGGLWGVLIGAVVVALTSQLADWRDLTPAIAEGRVPDAQRGTLTTGPDRAPSVIAGGDSAPRIVHEAPAVQAGGTVDVAEAPDTTPPGTPVALEPPQAPTPDVSIAALPNIGVADTAPAIENVRMTAEYVPASDTLPDIGPAAEAPAADPPELVADIGVPVAPEAGVAKIQVPSAPEQSPVIVAEAAGVTAPQAATDPLPMPPVAPEPAAALPPAVKEPQAPEVELAEATAPPAAGVSVPGDEVAAAPRLITPAPPESEAGRAVADAPAADPAPAAETPQVSRIALAETGTSLPGARVLRLPRIGDAVEMGAPPVEAPAPDADTAGNSALKRFSVPFEAREGVSLIAVVMIEEADGGQAMAVPGEMAVPVSVAVPAGHAAAADLARAHRAAGREVVLIPDLPPRAQARDVEVALPVSLMAVPGALAILDRGEAGFQDNRGATSSVIATAREAGLGVVTYARGFNTVGRLADQAGVPAAEVFRAIEGADDARAVVRALDQAAFRARRDGGIVLVAPARDTVLAGLMTWSEKSRNDDVVLAPLSAVLTRP